MAILFAENFADFPSAYPNANKPNGNGPFQTYSRPFNDYNVASNTQVAMASSTGDPYSPGIDAQIPIALRTLCNSIQKLGFDLSTTVGLLYSSWRSEGVRYYYFSAVYVNQLSTISAGANYSFSTVMGSKLDSGSGPLLLNPDAASNNSVYLRKNVATLKNAASTILRVNIQLSSYVECDPTSNVVTAGFNSATSTILTVGSSLTVTLSTTLSILVNGVDSGFTFAILRMATASPLTYTTTNLDPKIIPWNLFEVEISATSTKLYFEGTLIYTGASEWDNPVIHVKNDGAAKPLWVRSFVVSDDTGTQNTGLLGKVKVSRFFPTADAGQNEMTGVSTPKAALMTPVAGTTYNATKNIYTSSAEKTELFTVTPPTTTTQILAVGIGLNAIGLANSDLKLRPLLKVNGTLLKGSFIKAIPNNSRVQQNVWNTNDQGQAFSAADLQSLQVGFKTEQS